MSANAGQLLVARKHLTLAPGANDIDTGLKQNDRSFGNMSNGEPADGALPPGGPSSRVQVVPLAPTANWTGVTHTDPFYNATTGTVHVVFTNAGGQPVDVNVLFWNPAAIVGPCQGDFYVAP